MGRLPCWLTQLSQLGASLPFLPECAVQRGPVDDHLEDEGLGTAEPSLEGNNVTALQGQLGILALVPTYLCGLGQIRGILTFSILHEVGPPLKLLGWARMVNGWPHAAHMHRATGNVRHPQKRAFALF